MEKLCQPKSRSAIIKDEMVVWFSETWSATSEQLMKKSNFNYIY